MAAADTETRAGLVGRRARVAGNLATIRWGPGPLQAPPSKRPQPTGDNEVEKSAGDVAAQLQVSPATVEVVGIEYDEPGLGKHDGTHQGVRVFECENGKGSFVKLEKIELGISIQRALGEKYFAGMMPDAAKKGQRKEELDALDYTDSKGREKEMSVELVGRYDIEQRQQRLEGFMEIALADSNLCTRYGDDELWEGDWSLPNLRSLWLDKTLIEDWSDVAAICELCPQLEWLSLVRTRLASPPDSALDGVPLPEPRGNPPVDIAAGRLALTTFKCQVKTLILSSTMVTWKDVLGLEAAGVFPCLEHLHLAHNRLSEGVPIIANTGAAAPEGSAPGIWRLDRPPLPRLRTLVLDHNGIGDWRVISRAIVTFPILEALHLNGNNLGQTLDGLSELAADQTPRRLTTLFLNENRISSWRAVGALSAYVVLELKVQRNPITEGDNPIASPQLLRQLLVALGPMLLRLNASEVPTKERIAAERYFLAIYRQEGHPVISALADGCDIAAHAARLRAVHGDVVGGDVTEAAQATRSALVNALVEITLRPIGAVILDRPQVKKKVPHSMTVAELQRLAQMLFKQVPLPRIRLLLADPGLPFGVPFDDENRELGFYGVCDGAEIRVDDIADMKGDRDVARAENLAHKLESDDV